MTLRQLLEFLKSSPHDAHVHVAVGDASGGEWTLDIVDVDASSVSHVYLIATHEKHVAVRKTCDFCGGTGNMFNRTKKQCDVCRGSGVLP